ncbi:hypothetical protein C8R46DRAFT_470298 [Mycena filopes]|nr:hypothetical protein C8R46DRAFT_470298 [Mycena filopes]
MHISLTLVALAVAFRATLGQTPLNGQLLDSRCPSGTTVAGLPTGECQCKSVEDIKSAGGQICRDAAVANSFASCEVSAANTSNTRLPLIDIQAKSPGPAQCWFTCNPGFQWSDSNKTACVPLPALDFSATNWIWTSGMAAGSTPAGDRMAARKVFIAPEGKVPVLAQILSAADDSHTVYVNGRAVSSATTWGVPQTACSSLNPCLNVFAIRGTNDLGSLAGVIAKIRVIYLDGSSSTLVTDSSWRVDGSVPAGFETLAFDDSAWDTAYIITPSPWKPFASLPPSQQCELPSKPPCACNGGCAPVDSETVKSELECSADAGRVEFLSAVPGEGCVCKSTLGPDFCGTPSGDDDALQMCSDKTSNGKREVKCFVQCSAGLVEKDKNTCQKPETSKPPTDSSTGPCGCTAAAHQALEEQRQEREEARQAREEEKVERAEAKKAREEEREFREQQMAAGFQCGCSGKPSPPSIADAPPVADAQVQALIAETTAKLGLQPCPMGYEYVKTAVGYQCRGGAHRITFEQLGMK